MADNENTDKGTKAAKEQPEPAHDAWDRRVVEENEPHFAGSNRNRVNSGDFGVVSAELTAEDDPDNPGVAKVDEEAVAKLRQDRAEAAKAARDQG